MIVKENINVKVSRQNINYYKNLGYKSIKVNDIITIPNELLPKSSKTKIKVECDYCGKENNIMFSDYNRINSGIVKKYACKECRGKKTKESNIIVYGVSNIMQLDENKEKIKKTMINRYGVESALQCEEFLNKAKQSMIERFGTDNVNSLPSIKEKIKQTNIEKYGVESYTQTEEYLEKTKQTNLDKYGVENVFQNEEIRSKQRDTVNEKYGCDNVFQNEKIKEKIKQSMVKKYGVDSPMKVKEIKDKVIINGLKTKYKYGTQICSLQQKYIHSLIGGKLNYPIDKISLDIAFPEEKIYVEYNGSGHDLDVKIGRASIQNFKTKEIRRYKYLKSLGWKQIVINSPEDLLPEDETIISEIGKAKLYLKESGNYHYIININKINYINLRKLKTSTVNKKIIK